MRNKIFHIIFTLILITSVFSIPTTVYADSPEVLRNPGFEDDVDFWEAQVVAELTAVDHWEGVNPQSGNVFMLVRDRYSYSDTPLQHIKDPLTFYGKGQYRVRGYVRLAPSSSASAGQAQIVIRLVSSDKTSGSPSFPGVTWLTSGMVSINKTSWTLLEAQISIDWSANLEAAEFYFMTHQSESATDLCFDSASMVKIGYEGPAWAPPTPTPSPTPRPATPTPSRAPTTPATPTLSASPTTFTSSPAATLTTAPTAYLTPSATQTPSIGPTQAISAPSSEDSSQAESSPESDGISQSPVSEESDASVVSGDSSEASAESYAQDSDKGPISIQAILGIVILVLLIGGAALILITKKRKED